MDERAPDETGSTGRAEAADEPSALAAPGGWARLGAALGRVVALTASAAVVAATGYGWWTFGGLDDNTVTTNVISDEVAAQTPAPLDGAIDLLLVGMDSRTDAYGNPLPREVLELLNAGRAEGERNTDTMILVHIPVDGRRAVAFSFPRDSWVDIGDGFGKRRLNSAFAHAYNDTRATLQAQGVTDQKVLDDRAKVAGRKNLIAAIERLVGNEVTVERYAEVNLASFYEVTRAIGGVEVCLRNPVDEWRSGARFPAGRQTVSGREALAFVRQRYDLPNGDLDRIVRQQVFLAALADKVLSADMLTSPGKARELISAVQRSVVLSSGWNLSRFAAQMQGLTSGNIEFHTIPTLGRARIGGADVIQVDPQQVRDHVARISRASDRAAKSSGAARPTTLSPPPSTASEAPPSAPSGTTSSTPPAEIVVEVRNGTTTRGLAEGVLKSLTGLGFTPGGIGDAAVQVGSVIRHAVGESAKARQVAASLSGVFGFEEDSAMPLGHVRVVLGTGYEGGAATSGRAPPPGSATTPTTPDPNAPPTRIEAGSVPCVN